MLCPKFSENEKRNLRIINMAVKENELYFVADSFSGIFRFDITNFKDTDSNYIGEVIDNSEHRWQQPYGYICMQCSFSVCVWDIQPMATGMHSHL